MKNITNIFLLWLLYSKVTAQIILSGSAYQQDFNQLALGLPQGWSVRTSANAHNLGNDVSHDFVAIPTPTVIGANGTYWKNITAKFKNFASFKSALIGNYVLQASETDRALGVRQSSTFGDPGAAFVLCIANTQAFQNFQLAFDLQSLDDTNGERQTTWSIDYGIGETPSTFSVINSGYTTGANQVFSNRINVILPPFINNQNQKVWIRIVTLSASTNPINAANPTRTSSAIDNFTLNYQLMPTPITLSKFEGEVLSNQTTELRWETIEEVNNDFFQVERSKDMLNFEVIAMAKTKGNSKEEKRYSIIDKAPFIGINYYRLCQVDKDGALTYYKPIALEVEWLDTKDVKLYPSILTINQALLLRWTKESPPIIQISSINGSKISFELIQKESQNYEIRLAENLFRGVAIVSVWWENSRILTQKVIVE